MTLQHDKTELRRQFLALRSSLSQDERAEAETTIRNKLFSLSLWKKTPLVCGYMPICGEIDLLPIWKRAVSLCKNYALPVTVTDTREGRMIFRRVSGYTPQELVPARFGLSEPAPVCPALLPRDFQGALILVPGLAFDDSGYRIGYGGGYYDRFINELKSAGISVTTVGLAFSACRVPVLPREPHDRAVDLVIDERRMIVTYGQ